MALRIIDLDIDESLSADTRVSEIGWVLQPAIETELMFFSNDRMDEASLKKVKDYILEYQPGMLPGYVNYATGDTKDDMLIRIYNVISKEGYFGKSILNEEDLLLFIWNWDFANFQIIINKQYPNECHLQMNIYATEENTFISSKLDIINKNIDKINKIKNEILSR